MTPKSRSYVRELNLVHLETMQRESLAVHSYMDAYLTAVSADLKKHDEANPYVLRALSAHTTKVQPEGGEGTRAPESDSIVSPSLGSVLSRSGQTGRVRCNGRSASSKTVHSRDVSHRVWFLLPGISSTKEVVGGGGDWGWRLVIDLSKLNEYLTPVTFQIDTLAKLKAVAEQGMFATFRDLSDAYHYVPMRED